ncbi:MULTISPECIES: ribbon-helix-helix domain-containing protein [unclassified Azospirillum]|uniref:ribbon-helix-helix domain-containing protein n=1 Tax=unclassified Azospirillum TaxID=2630922 RepID=UPI000B71DE71|nr:MULTISPECIES: ribbon-helix-helix domain-containing protein [unclassified Azospirillum]SNS18807.1 Predicted DNA-binding protein, contains Ribbon-helix-helix (RHH) domain [Azospirillum sp. RU38E]SNS36474.1 Predicted DNA-binding protein, contains Ribbon-helix-helix (RHH) domain [Azospirillum sp. RU37A]
MPYLTKIAPDQDNDPVVSHLMRRALDEVKEIDHTVTRNLIVCGHRTSIRIDSMTWKALGNIARGEGMTINEVASHIAAKRQGDISLTAAIRMFVVGYLNWRSPARPRSIPAA